MSSPSQPYQLVTKSTSRVSLLEWLLVGRCWTRGRGQVGCESRGSEWMRDESVAAGPVWGGSPWPSEVVLRRPASAAGMLTSSRRVQRLSRTVCNHSNNARHQKSLPTHPPTIIIVNQETQLSYQQVSALITAPPSHTSVRSVTRP